MPCGNSPLNVQQLTCLINDIVDCKLQNPLQFIEDCVVVTVAGDWGNIGDVIQVIRWFDPAQKPPVTYVNLYINTRLNKAVTGITTDNSTPCKSFEVVGNPCWIIGNTEAEIQTILNAGIGGVLVTTSITLTSTLDVTLPLWILPCGEIITNGNTLLIDKDFEAGSYQVFNSAINEVLFAEGSVERVLPQWFGAIGDDSTDCTSSINNALASLKVSGGNVFFPAGTYKILGPLNSYSNVSLFGTGDGSIIKSGFSLLQGQSLVNFIGTETTSTTLTANTGIGSRVVQVVDTSIFVVDAYVYLLSASDTWAELHRIKSIDSPTQITFHEIMGFDWIITDFLLNGDWVSYASVQNMRFIGTEVATERSNDRFEDHAVNCQKAHHITVNNCSFLNIGSRAIIFIDKCSECIASNNRVVKTYDRSIESHVKTSGNIISNNVLEGGLIGISIHGIGTVCIGNTCYGQYGFDSGNTLRGSGIAGGDAFGVNISGNTIHGAQREGMAIGSNINDSRISENLISYSKRDGMTVYGNNNSITNNHFYQNGTVVGDACISFVASCSFTFVNGNYFHARVDPSVTTRAIASTFDQFFLNLGSNQYVNFPGALTDLTVATTYMGLHIGEAEGLRRIFAASTTWDPPLIATGSYAFKDVSNSGCLLGDKSIAGFTIQIPDGAFLAAQVLSPGVVRVSLYNFTGGNIDLASGTLSVESFRDRFGINGDNG